MSYKIEEIEGIGPTYAEKLQAVSIQTTDDYLAKCATKAGRSEVAEATGISETHLLEWANLADLMRIKGVGEEYADLLEEAGVDTVKELATRNAENLVAKMEEVNASKNLVDRTPSETLVSGWIEEAGTLEPMISH